MRKSLDTAWKQLLTQFLPDFIEFAYADLAKEIDWLAPSLALEQELHRLTPRHRQGKKIVDKVFRLKHKENQSTYSFVHIEIQNKQTNFNERMARYYARLIDRWGPRVLSVRRGRKSLSSSHHTTR